MNRPPIVAILGHVDHGKTTLLDKIRSTNIQAREVGGITQSIGASVIVKDGKEITFIDTPGHAAFSSMRISGATAADIVVLVVAADDGVKPQTTEAIKHIKDSKTPFLVALTKIDLATANKKAALGSLEKEGILLEGRGGDTPVAEVSGKTGKGIDDLLDLINLVAEVNEVDSEDELSAIVVETSKGKSGPLVSVVVKSGALSVAQKIGTSEVSAKVRGLFDHNGKSVKQIKAGLPAQVLGFSEMPRVGEVLRETENIIEKSQKINKMIVPEGGTAVVIKAASTGSLEAIKASLPSEAVVVKAESGDVGESDILLAKDMDARVLAFESRVPVSAKKLAETEGVEVKTFVIIYELLAYVEEIIEGKREKVLGTAKIVASFPFNKKQIAGCVMVSGEIKKGDRLTLKKGEEELGTATAKSLRKQKDEVEKVAQGEEFGVLLIPQLDFEKGDVLLSLAQPGQ